MAKTNQKLPSTWILVDGALICVFTTNIWLQHVYSSLGKRDMIKLKP